MSDPELLPTRVGFRPDEPVRIEVRGLSAPASLTAWRFGALVTEVPVDADGVIDLGPMPSGGYGIELGDARTAVEVRGDPRGALRYGFVVDYRPDRDPAAVQDNLRRLHLSGIQFYDWAYRHADLLGGGEQYADALDQPVSLETVRALVAACHEVGADALGYAAVYAVGPNEWPKWEHDALLTPSGPAYALGDFLFLVDPAAADWREHFTADLVQSTRKVGFDGFHLDQYGYPKYAARADGASIDVADSFVSLVDSVRGALPESRLVFNNVNDFPTWSTAGADQDAVYVEVWPPHVGLEHLAAVATRARSVGGAKPVVVAAYQHVYDSAPAEAADRATALTMATLFSHGATQLLCGEADRILVDPYYVRNHVVEPSTASLLRRYYDFAVEHGELLFDADIADVTGSVVGAYNDDIDVSFAGVEVGHDARAGAVWRRVTRLPDGRYVVHLVNLTGQHDTAWDAAREPFGATGPGTLRVRRSGTDLPRVLVASPDDQPRLVPVEALADADHARAQLPTVHAWQLIVIDPSPDDQES